MFVFLIVFMSTFKRIIYTHVHDTTGNIALFDNEGMPARFRILFDTDISIRVPSYIVNSMLSLCLTDMIYAVTGITTIT